MAELIALLMLTVSQMLGSGTPPAEMAAGVAATIEANSPFAVEEVAVKFVREDPEDLPEGYNPAGETYRIDFAFTDIEIEPLLIHDLDISVGGISFNEDDKLNLAWIDFQALIEDGALEDALKSHAPSIKDPSLMIRRRGISLGGGYQTWLGAVPFTVEGDLVVEDDTELVFLIDRSSMAGVGVPGPVNDLVEREVNPVYDLKEFVKRSRKDIDRAKEQLDYEFKLEVKRITPGNGHIIVAGTA